MHCFVRASALTQGAPSEPPEAIVMDLPQDSLCSLYPTANLELLERPAHCPAPQVPPGALEWWWGVHTTVRHSLRRLQACVSFCEKATSFVRRVRPMNHRASALPSADGVERHGYARGPQAQDPKKRRDPVVPLAFRSQEEGWAGSSEKRRSNACELSSFASGAPSAAHFQGFFRLCRAKPGSNWAPNTYLSIPRGLGTTGGGGVSLCVIFRGCWILSAAGSVRSKNGAKHVLGEGDGRGVWPDPPPAITVKRWRVPGASC